MEQSKAARRIGKELKGLQTEDKLSFCEVAQKSKDELMIWVVKMTGPVSFLSNTPCCL